MSNKIITLTKAGVLGNVNEVVTQWGVWPDGFVHENPIVVPKTFATAKFFEKCRARFDGMDEEERLFKYGVDSADMYLVSVNSWLAVLTYFGWDLEYDQDFCQFGADHYYDMFISCFIKQGSEQPIAERFFHGRTMSRSQFMEELGNFGNQHNYEE